MFHVTYMYLGQTVKAWISTDDLVEMCEQPSFTYKVHAYTPPGSL